MNELQNKSLVRDRLHHFEFPHSFGRDFRKLRIITAGRTRNWETTFAWSHHAPSFAEPVSRSLQRLFWLATDSSPFFSSFSFASSFSSSTIGLTTTTTAILIGPIDTMTGSRGAAELVTACVSVHQRARVCALLSRKQYYRLLEQVCV